MDGYGQFCPVALAAEVFARRWTPIIVRELLCGSTRFNELRRGMPLISASTLARRLDELVVAGVVERRREGEGTVYALTPAGEELRPVVEQLGVWGRRWLKSDYRDEDLDPRLLVWDIHRNIRLDAVGGRVDVELHLHDAPPGRRNYWLILTPQDADVCLTPPGGDIDLRIVSDVRTLTRVWMGDTTWDAALASGALAMTGSSDLRRAFPTWLRYSVFAGVDRAAEPCAAPAATG